MGKTKIVCTLGPSSSDEKILKKMISSGMNVARLNFSHGTHQEQKERIKKIKRLSQEMGKPIAIILDLQGPRIRLGNLKETFLRKGSTVTLTFDKRPSKEKIPLDFDLSTEVKPGESLLLCDGLVELKVKKVKGKDIECLVISGGKISSHKGVNLPEVPLKTPALTLKDKEDLKFGLKHGVDFVALSFVRQAKDILELKDLIKKEGFDVPVVAKIEKKEALKNIDEIIEHSDGIMVARGDLGVEISTEKVPIIQKEIIAKTNEKGKPVITATQMLESMINSPKPTRAEASDVANAIFDGTDAVMLSGETAIGIDPVNVVKTMEKIIENTESYLDYEDILRKRGEWVEKNTSDAISFAACELAKKLKVKAIITATQSGYTARQVSKYRPQAPIIAITPNPQAYRQLLLSWGIIPLLVKPSRNIDEILVKAVKSAKEASLVKKGDQVIITAGVLANVPGTTNMIKVHQVE